MALAMGKRSVSRVRVAALLLAVVGTALAVPTAADAQVRVGSAAESPADALARNVKKLASSPKDFEALIGAGKAALAMGDAQAAAGFFGRAQEVWPASPLPPAGMGAALAQEADAGAALQAFARAVQLGATQSMIGGDRGLAYDLLGQHAQAQADYRAAMLTPDGADEARRRLALSLAISGKKAEALQLLGPLMARGDAAAARCRAFVLALSGDAVGARTAIEAAMPGSSARMAYFFQKLPTLRSDQKAAAVHLGIFPDAGTQYASAEPAYPLPGSATAGSSQGSGDRLASIEDLLRQGQPRAAPQPPISRPTVTPPPARPTQVVSLSRTNATRSAPAEAAGRVYDSKRVWLQLASGSNVDALPDQFRRLKSRYSRLFDGISGYVAEEKDRARLLIGPFRNAREADIFAEDLATVRVDAFSWTNAPGQVISKLPAE